MKYSYSLLKKLLPKVPAISKLAEAFNNHVFEVESVDGDVLDIKLYANRYSDAVSHIGIAREASAIFGLPFKSPVKQLVNLPTHKGYLEIKVEEEKLCPRYATRYFEIPGKLPVTPPWMKKALASCGVKSINPIVDIMNYVMLETGQPLHAFDFEKVADMNIKDQKSNIKKKATIIVRKAKKGEKIETLDNQQIELDADILVIADKERPLAIAGIKGGKDSGVHAGTRSIVVEAANFDAPIILKNSRRLKLITDAAVRFTHDISPALVEWGLDRATELLTQMGCELKDSAEYYPKKAGDKMIQFDGAHYEALIGAPIALTQAKKHFVALGFEVLPPKKGEGILVRVPASRRDVEIEEDLIEEAGRLEGINKLKKSAPIVSLNTPHVDDLVILKDRVRDAAVRFGFDEVCNWSFVGAKELESAENLEGYPVASNVVVVENPMSEDFAFLRPSLTPGLLKNIESNGRFFDPVRIFEIGAVFTQKGPTHKDMGGVYERVHLGVALAATRDKEEWKSKMLGRELKGMVAEMLHGLGIVDVMLRSDGHAIRIESDHHVVGYIRTVPAEKNWTIGIAELDLTKLITLIEEEREYRPLPKFPSIMRDISLLVRDDARIGPLLEAIQGAAGENLDDVDLIDEFHDEKLGGKMSITFRLVFQSEEKTLTDEEINKEMESITKALRDKYGAEVR